MNNPFGFTAPGWGLGWGWAPSANAFIGQNLWEHYKFTDDKQYLQEKDLSDTEKKRQSFIVSF